MLHPRWLLFLGIICLFLGSPQVIAAQDGCVDDCRVSSCGHEYWEGFDGGCTACHADYDGSSCAKGECPACNIAPQRVTAVAVHEISAALQDASPLAVAEVVEEYGTRLLLNPERRMIIIKGGCDGEALVSLVYVPEAAIREFMRLDVPTLRESKLTTNANGPSQ